MRGQYIVVCDEDIFYARQLVSYLEKYLELDVLYLICNHYDKVLEYEERYNITLIIINEKLLPDKEIKVSSFLLTECSDKKNNSNYIYKYQSMKKVVAMLYKHFSGVNYHKEESSKVVNSDNNIALLSMVGREKIHIVENRLLSNLVGKSRAIVVKLNSLCYVNKVSSYNKNFSNYIYQIKNKIEDTVKFLKASIYEEDGIHYLGPCEHYIDLLEINEEDIKKMVYELKHVLEYNIIIVQMDFVFNDMVEILKHFSQIYVAYSNDTFSLNQFEHFLHTLAIEEEEEIKDQLIHFHVE